LRFGIADGEFLMFAVVPIRITPDVDDFDAHRMFVVTERMVGDARWRHVAVRRAVGVDVIVAAVARARGFVADALAVFARRFQIRQFGAMDDDEIHAIERALVEAHFVGQRLVVNRKCNGHDRSFARAQAPANAPICDNAAMKPYLILSHGLESGPNATKVSALAAIAEPMGFESVRPDYCDLDALRDVNRIDDRIARLKQHAPPDRPVILAGSSMGAFTSALASLDLDCVGLFLIALPVAIKGYPRKFDARHVPTALVHGWDDELCPVDDAIAFARSRGDSIMLVKDDHRLSTHVDFIARQFREFLGQFV
jgi:predicted alpha/beta-hydrolase family hydrolase